MNHHFNLIEQPWLPCIGNDGRPDELGLRDLLAQAHDIRELYAETPLTTAALHRLLLAVLYAAFRDVGENEWVDFWKEVWQMGDGHWPQARLDQYFSAVYDRFDLFHPQHPFYQMTPAQLDDILRRIKPKPDQQFTDPISRLAEEYASGQNPTLFDHTMDDLVLSPAEAARRLITAHAFSLGGGKSGVPGIKNYAAGPCAGAGMLFLIQGDNLFQTLALNLVRRTVHRPLKVVDRARDLPAWEQETALEPGPKTPYGYLDYLTWQSRRIKLVPVEEDGRLQVREIYFYPGREIDKALEDPMAAFKIVKRKNNKEERVQIRLNPDRALWRDSGALFSVKRARAKATLCPTSMDWVGQLVRYRLVDRHKRYHYIAFGLKTKQGGLIEIQRQERLPLPVALLDDEGLLEYLQNALGAAERIGDILRGAEITLLLELALLRQEDLTNYQEVEKARNTFKLTYLYWSRLEVDFQQFIKDLPDRPGAALTAWQQILLRYARAAFREGTATLVGVPGNSKALAVANNQLEARLWPIRKKWQSEEDKNL